NPVIRGWATSHRHDASKATFGAVDAAIFKVLWQWARRRHPNKNKSWVKEKYFHTQGNRRWVFSGKDIDAKGNPRPVWLFSASKRPIKRQTKIKAGANPYDPAWEVYFEQRLGVKMETHLTGKRGSATEVMLAIRYRAIVGQKPSRKQEAPAAMIVRDTCPAC